MWVNIFYNQEQIWEPNNFLTVTSGFQLATSDSY